MILIDPWRVPLHLQCLVYERTLRSPRYSRHSNRRTPVRERKSMPGNDHSKVQPEHSDTLETPGQPRLSRRSLLGAAGVGAAGVAAGAFGGLAMAQAATKPAQSKAQTKPAESKPAASENNQQQDSGDHIVIHLRSGRSGEFDVYRGTSHTRVNDPELAARLRRTSL
jgi:hypothetical protein